jgi:hypothetical protein
MYLSQFLADFELLKLEIRLCIAMKIPSIKKQAQLSFLMDGIGKQITGWRNANQ